MAEVRVTQAGALVEHDAQAVRATQAAALVEHDAQVVRASQVVALVEFDQIRIHATQVVVLVEYEYAPASTPVGGKPDAAAGERTTSTPTPTAPPGTAAAAATTGAAPSGGAQPAAPGAAPPGTAAAAATTGAAPSGGAQPAAPGAAPPGTAAAAATTGAAPSMASAGSRRAIAAANRIFQTLAESRATLAPGTTISLTPAATGMGGMSDARIVKAKIEIDWTGTATYVDESANLLAARGEMRLTAPGSALMAPKGSVSRMSVTLFNRKDAVTGRRYSPLNTASPLYSALADGGAYHRPMRFSVSVDGGSTYVRVFTGVIKIPSEGVPTPTNEATIDIECRTVDETLLQLKLSTTQAAFAANVLAQPTEAELIKQVLEHADIGLTSSDYEIDRGAFPFQWFWLDDESALDELWSLAAAAGGRLYANADGLLVYENMQHWLFHDEASETLDRASYERLTLRYDDRDIYSDVTVEAAPRRLAEDAVLWEPDEAIQVPAGGTRAVTAKLRQPAFAVDAVEYTAVTSGGLDLTAQVTMAVTVYAQRVEMTFTNANATFAATLTGLTITGTPVAGGPDIEETAASAATFWTDRRPRARSVRGNVYIQTRAQARALAEFLRDTQETPRLSYSLQGLFGEPARRVGDRITIDDDQVMSAERDAYITAVTWTFDRGGYRQSVEAIDATSVFKYDLDEYFILGTDELGGGKRIFY